MNRFYSIKYSQCKDRNNKFFLTYRRDCLKKGEYIQGVGKIYPYFCCNTSITVMNKFKQQSEEKVSPCL